MKLDARSKIPSLLRIACFSLASLLVGWAMAGESGASAAAKPRAFTSTEEAVQALVEALRAEDVTALVAIVGKEDQDLIETGDMVQAKEGWRNFVELYDQKHDLDTSTAGRAVMVIGNKDWPFPIPLVKTKEGWIFDVKQGREEILNRRIGTNELSTIQTCLAIADAQGDYFRQDHDGDGILEYAGRFASTEGKKDGLYWSTGPGEPLSPLGDLFASAAAEGYTRSTTGEPIPYHGYFFKVLTSQGKSAPGGAYDYMVRGHLIGGFGVFAHPATYGVTGVMSFLTNQDGVVYQKDLGPKTASKAKKITSFDPEAGWIKVAEADLKPFPPAD